MIMIMESLHGSENRESRNKMARTELQNLKDKLQSTCEDYRVGVKLAFNGRVNSVYDVVTSMLNDKELIKKYGDENLKKVGRDLIKMAGDCKDEIEHIKKFSHTVDVFCGIKNRRMNNNIIFAGTHIEDLLDAIYRAHDTEDENRN